jgi:hypothetical protein
MELVAIQSSRSSLIVVDPLYGSRIAFAFERDNVRGFAIFKLESISGFATFELKNIGGFTTFELERVGGLATFELVFGVAIVEGGGGGGGGGEETARELALRGKLRRVREPRIWNATAS